MSFQDVRNAPEKQWVDLVNVLVLKITNTGQDQYQNHTQEIVGQDDSGQQLSFRLQTKYVKGLLDDNDVNRKMLFRLKWFTSREGQSLTGYPQKPSSASPAPALRKDQPNKVTPVNDYDDKKTKENRGKCRFGFYQAAIRSGMAPVSIVKDKANLEAIETLVGYSMNGPSLGDQFARDYNLPTMEEEMADYEGAKQANENKKPPF